MGILQGIRTLCRYDFEISSWYRLLFVELVFHVNGGFRLVILFTEPPRYQPPYWELIVCAFIAILFAFTILKLWLLISGLTYKNAIRLRCYAILNAVVLPLVIPFLVYLRWQQWYAQPSRWDTAMEIGVFLLFVIVGIWGIYWAVPRLVQKHDFTYLKRLERYVTIHPVPDATTPGKLEYERYSRKTSSATSVNSLGKDFAVTLPEKLKNFFISPLNVSIDKDDVIGEGQFGFVYKSYLLQKGERLLVVAKSAKHDDIHSIVNEIVINIHVDVHPNIVHFLGVTSDALSGSFYLLSEYCEGGCLLAYLERLKPYKSTQYVNINGSVGLLKVQQLLRRFSQEILMGMSYLTLKGVVHGDLSARNIVLSVDLKIKICDFGMSTKLYNYQLYTKNMQQELLPWRWMSVEALEDLKFSEKSDVYAYGVTLWELYTLGTVPHDSTSWSMAILQRLRNDELILEKPQLADDFVYFVMSLCWQVDSSIRPAFVQLQEMFKTHFSSSNIAS